MTGEQFEFVKLEAISKSKPTLKNEAILNLGSIEEHEPTRLFLEDLFEAAIEEGASDLHFKPNDEGIRVQLRVNGVLRDFREKIQRDQGGFLLPRDAFHKLVQTIKVRSGMKVNVSNTPQDGRMSHCSKKHNKSVQLRVSTLPCELPSKRDDVPEKIVMRLLDVDNVINVKLDQLLVHEKTRRDFQNALLEGAGINLVTGPTGSGKSTSLYSALLSYDLNSKNVSTVEDPVEYFIDGLTQVEIKENGVSFSGALRALMRQDPDVILVGEIRDEETAKIAVHAALTGHTVLSTVHAPDPVTALTRLAELGVELTFLKDALKFVSSQRLKRKLCPNCRMEAGIEQIETMRESFGFNINHGFIPNLQGCSHCQGGFKGRMGVVGYFKSNDHIRGLIERRNFEEIRRVVDEDFFSIETARDDLIQKGFLNTTDSEW